VDNEVGIHGTFVAFVLTWDFLVSTYSRQRNGLKASFDAQLLSMLAVPALYGYDSGFRGQGRCANDYARYAHQCRNVVGYQITDGDVFY